MTGRGAALVTGAAGGLGRAIARRLHDDGFTVIALDLQALEDDHLAESLICDLRDPAAILSTMEALHARHGSLALLVNNAAVYNPRTDFFALSPADIMRTVEVNLVAPALLTQVATKAMIDAARPGVVINIASVSGILGTTQIDYGMTKAGVILMTRALGRVLAPHGIRINAVAPGHLTTGMGVDVTEATRTSILSLTPMGRSGEPEEIAATVSFLASPGASYVTGETLAVTGGV